MLKYVVSHQKRSKVLLSLAAHRVITVKAHQYIQPTAPKGAMWAASHPAIIDPIGQMIQCKFTPVWTGLGITGSGVEVQTQVWS